MKKLTIGSFEQEACAGAPAPPGETRPPRALIGCRFRIVMTQIVRFNFFRAPVGVFRRGHKRKPQPTPALRDRCRFGEGFSSLYPLRRGGFPRSRCFRKIFAALFAAEHWKPSLSCPLGASQRGEISVASEERKNVRAPVSGNCTLSSTFRPKDHFSYLFPKARAMACSAKGAISS